MKKLLFVLVLIISATAANAQGGKAYEIVKFQCSDSLKGKIVFNYADGYENASEIVASVAGKQVKFIYSPERSTTRTKTFILYKNGKADPANFFKLNLNWNEPLPTTITGTCGNRSQVYQTSFLRIFR